MAIALGVTCIPELKILFKKCSKLSSKDLSRALMQAAADTVDFLYVMTSVLQWHYFEYRIE